MFIATPTAAKSETTSFMPLSGSDSSSSSVDDPSSVNFSPVPARTTALFSSISDSSSFSTHSPFSSFSLQLADQVDLELQYSSPLPHQPYALRQCLASAHFTPLHTPNV